MITADDQGGIFLRFINKTAHSVVINVEGAPHTSCLKTHGITDVCDTGGRVIEQGFRFGYVDSLKLRAESSLFACVDLKALAIFKS